jgi:hypothetical protein
MGDRRCEELTRALGAGANCLLSADARRWAAAEHGGSHGAFGVGLLACAFAGAALAWWPARQREGKGHPAGTPSPSASSAGQQGLRPADRRAGSHGPPSEYFPAFRRAIERRGCA